MLLTCTNCGMIFERAAWTKNGWHNVFCSHRCGSAYHGRQNKEYIKEYQKKYRVCKRRGRTDKVMPSQAYYRVLFDPECDDFTGKLFSALEFKAMLANKALVRGTRYQTPEGEEMTV